MPRAYYKPFTAYEEAFGFHATRRNAYIMCSVLFGGLLLKCMLLVKYSSVVNPNRTSPLEDDPRYQELMERRLVLTEDLSTQDTRPRDICTAAFEGDTARVEQLVTAAGVYSGRWHSPFVVDTSAAARDALAHWEGVGNDEDDEGYGGAEEDIEEVLGEEEMAKLKAHPVLRGIVKAYSLDEQALGGAAEDGEGADSVAEHIQQHGLLRMSTTPPVDMTLYGILFSCREVPTAAVGAAVSEESSVPLQVRWQPSKRSRYAGTPLHWAVLARAHDTVRFLVEHGADCSAGLKAVTNDGAAPDAQLAMCDQKVLGSLTPARMAADNESHSTLEVLERAVAAQEARRADEEAFFIMLEKRLRRRREEYLRRFEEARAQRLREAEEARRAEAEEGEEAEESDLSGEDKNDSGSENIDTGEEDEEADG
ncbi:Ankyrin repeat family protein [Leishmania donovani]|uniref:Ankyrin repeat family protein n=1 Tax=Leishmania donovani TaxID=5661 RepID=A0A504XTR1_LEIDO|nr:Ankyrin repeat family protein [Leishmania donovani]